MQKDQHKTATDIGGMCDQHKKEKKERKKERGVHKVIVSLFKSSTWKLELGACVPD